MCHKAASRLDTKTNLINKHTCADTARTKLILPKLRLCLKGLSDGITGVECGKKELLYVELSVDFASFRAPDSL